MEIDKTNNTCLNFSDFEPHLQAKAKLIFIEFVKKHENVSLIDLMDKHKSELEKAFEDWISLPVVDENYTAEDLKKIDDDYFEAICNRLTIE